MKAGRELDAKVAEALGWEVVSVHDDNDYCMEVGSGDLQGYVPIPRFSTTWEGMSVLVEEAKKQGIYLEYSHSLNGGYYAGAFSFDDGEYQMDCSTEQAVPTAPHAVALVYLMAKGVIANA
ncbi:hypothetical protein H7K32_11510 [Brevibacillus agri]|uniref:hypothetical protein n=1 Tax=Brevibacillus agri TaxID=51101 RepID=UPI001C8D2436|nr:hypothetical protein [Brevibacillus agri]MBY0052299.1 hypothetical protein [Brevibacillus agri]